MSAETDFWLNNYVLVGYTDQRKDNGSGWFKQDGTGHAWHYREELQGAESNHYPGPIPVEDVLRRLFHWHAVSVPLEYIGPDGIRRVAEDRQAIIADDNSDLLGIFKGGYQGHQYDEWLIRNVAKILGDGLGIASAAELRNRGQAFVQLELPENITTPEGFTFRPYIGACTSFDGTLATTYKKGATAWVCDNSLQSGLAEDGELFRVKHTANSQLRINDAREALGIIERISDEFAATIAQLAATDVTLKEWEALLDELVPVPDDKGRSRTIAESKRDELETLYARDERVAPWSGTSLGVLQAFNTWGQHYKTVKGAARLERNLSDIVFGKIADDDDNTLSVLNKIRSQRTLLHV